MKVKIKQTTFLEKDESRDPIKHAHIWIQFQDSNLCANKKKKTQLYISNNSGSRCLLFPSLFFLYLFLHLTFPKINIIFFLKKKMVLTSSINLHYIYLLKTLKFPKRTNRKYRSINKLVMPKKPKKKNTFTKSHVQKPSKFQKVQRTH